jgi:hypothetical protein
MDQRITFRLEAAHAEQLALLAHRRGRSTGEELRRAVEAHLAAAWNADTPAGQGERVPTCASDAPADATAA